MTTAEILSRFPGLSALVIGDVCLDRWCTYDPSLSEPSRETGIPRTAVIRTEVTPGAAGTVANNLIALGVGRVDVLGAIGHDGFGAELITGLEQRGIRHELLVQATALQTFTYTKLINAATGNEDLPRVDFINALPLDASVEQKVIDNLRQAAASFDVVLVSDQAETNQGGIVTAAVRSALSEIAARESGRIFFVDSRARLELFRGLTLKANEDEAEAARRRSRLATPRDLLQSTGAPALFITHGKRGVLALTRAAEQWVDTIPVDNPVDICGAGDSFSAGAAMTLAVTGSAVDAASFGNLVASITIMKKGTGTASPQELLATCLPNYSKHLRG